MRTSSLRRLAVPVAAGIVAVLLTGSGPHRPPALVLSPAGAGVELAADLDRLFTDPLLTGAQISAEVADAATGEVLYQRSPEALMLPASTLKTVTAAAALDLLGGEHRFTTEVLVAGHRSGSDALDGDLVLRGGGDPSLLPADLDTLARQVAQSGITSVSGAVLADASRYDGVPLGENWAWDDQPYYYSPQISALTMATDTDFDAGTVRLTVTPAATPGQPAEVRVTPAEAPVRLTGRISTGPAGGDYGVDVTRRLGGNEIVLAGSLPADGGAAEEWVTVEDPARVTAAVFAAALARHGVAVGHPVDAGRAPADATVLARHDSAPVADLLVPFLKLSNNAIAEHLVKEIGKVRAGSGSWQAGLAEVTAFLHRAGLDATPARQADGSGLSRHNLMSAQRFTALLGFARRQTWFPAWHDALPVAGDPRRMVGGTLSRRMTGTVAAGRVHAKTGSMTGADALTGYVDTTDGRTLAFTVLLNDFAGASPRAVIDRIAVRLAGGSAAAAVTPPAPQDDPALSRTRGRLGGSTRDWENCTEGRAC
ncbi:D-alanyl-D-alanine carboxypeptidase/D-alanyl-D-alanine-endopeptidase [Kitasatospora sp. NPDC050543]|uniref:D-alanyl-D-alanine carboxypeptidase/D-alanyl-D-alanine endopeptidase n=1 Tax=Kitasatospora sp. NPDC050543 TaxID=3364054 RepID=UPI003792FA83